MTAQLTLTAVALVLVVSLLTGTVATLVMRGFLLGQLDDDLRGSLSRASRAPSQAYQDGQRPGPSFESGGGLQPIGEGDSRFGQSIGTLTAYFDPAMAGDSPIGTVIRVDGRGIPAFVTLSPEVLDVLTAMPQNGKPYTVNLPELGSYRLMSMTTAYGAVVAGLPMEDVDELVGRMVLWQALLLTMGSTIATVAGLFLVRYQLRTLTEVARTADRVSRLPLSSGDIELAERVPERLTDTNTEVGQVGAALNALLSHMEESLLVRRRSEQQARQLVADVSHELRTPLTTMIGYAELAARRPEDFDLQALALAKVTDETSRMATLVEDLLLLARLDAGRNLEQAPVNLTELLTDAVFDAQALSPGHEWRTQVAAKHVWVIGDAGRLHQVITNLLSNSRRYTPEGSVITATVRSDGFSVHDNGPGFPPHIAQTAFERFVRGDDSRTRSWSKDDPGGTGLGLSLVRAIVEAHGGHVRINSRPGDTTINVWLPESEVRSS